MLNYSAASSQLLTEVVCQFKQFLLQPLHTLWTPYMCATLRGKLEAWCEASHYPCLAGVRPGVVCSAASDHAMRPRAGTSVAITIASNQGRARYDFDAERISSTAFSGNLTRTSQAYQTA